jgi:hypothetical protein
MTTIGEKLRAIDELANRSDDVPASRPENKEKAEGSRETIVGNANDAKNRRKPSEPEEERDSDR